MSRNFIVMKVSVGYLCHSIISGGVGRGVVHSRPVGSVCVAGGWSHFCSSLCFAVVMRTSSIQECNYTLLIKVAIQKVREDSVRSSSLLRTGVYIVF